MRLVLLYTDGKPEEAARRLASDGSITVQVMYVAPSQQPVQHTIDAEAA